MAPRLFIVPAAHAAPSGGNLYNEGLLAGLQALDGSTRYARASVEELPELSLAGYADVWLDSLYLAQACELRARLARGARLFLLAHALPSDLAQASGQPSAALRERERAWLGAFDAALVPSRTMAGWLAQRVPSLPCLLVAPAVQAQKAQRSAELSRPRVLIIANLVPNKGVLPFLDALERALGAQDRLELRILGGFDADPGYARACQGKLAGSALLSARVQLLGVQPFGVVLDELARAHVLVSASRSESFGLAVSDARASGCVVLARTAGHLVQLVSAEAGGALLADDAELVQALLALCRDQVALRERLERAAVHALPTRSWNEAAADLLSQLATSSLLARA